MLLSNLTTNPVGRKDKELQLLGIAESKIIFYFNTLFKSNIHQHEKNNQPTAPRELC